jgi:hypothetical protein
MQKEESKTEASKVPVRELRSGDIQKNANGIMICGHSGVDAEGTEHPLAFTKTSGTVVEVNGQAAVLTVTDEVHLASKKLWSTF